MIEMQEAMERADVRMSRLTRGEPRAVMPAGELTVTCMGSDVRGPDLEAVLEGLLIELVGRAAGTECQHGTLCSINCVLTALMRGDLLCMFWLGYEARALEEEPF